MHVPGHIAFIMDGNGRWAKNKGLLRSEGHRRGVAVLKKILYECYGLGISAVSVFAFSTENWKRPVTEIEDLFAILSKYLDEELGELIEKNIRLRVMGDMTQLPAELRDKLSGALAATDGCTGGIFNICLNYGGRAEIISAVNRIIKDKVKAVDEKVFESYLYSSGLPDPDLIVRTSGEERLSNFMLYQSAYSELYFCRSMWPDFNKKLLLDAIESFSARQRRYGRQQ